jgi:hypothetical protein
VLLPIFSHAVHYKFITIDRKRILVEIKLKSPLEDDAKKEIRSRLWEKHLTNIDLDYFLIIHCTWCGTHVSHVIDFDKVARPGQYSSKEDWER